MAEQQYYFTALAMDIYSKDGDPLPPLSTHAMEFVGTVSEAQSRFFRKGYMLISADGLFVDDQKRFVHGIFPTAEYGNVPNQLNMLFSCNPYTSGVFAQFPVEDLRFGKLLVMRMIAPATNSMNGGGSRMRNRNRKTRRISRRTTRSRKVQRKP